MISSFSFLLLTDEVFTHHTPAPLPQAAAAAQPQAAASRSMLPKASQSGLRPPGFSSSRLPAGRLAAFGFVRSSSVSSVSSAHSADSTQSDPCRTAHRESARCRSAVLTFCEIWFVSCLFFFVCLFCLQCVDVYLLIPLVLSQTASLSLHHEHTITITGPSLLPHPPHEYSLHK